jgi:hypothetical protein
MPCRANSQGTRSDFLAEPSGSRPTTCKHGRILSICVFCYFTPARIGMGRRPRARSHFDAVRTSIGTALRSLYLYVLNEPLPDKIAELLRQLDQELSRLAQQKDADST